MHRLLTFVLTAVLLSTCPATARIDPFALELSHRVDTSILPPVPGRDCGDSLFVNHDGSFENGYCWSYGGYVPPYYGAFGEGLDLGNGEVTCGAFWFTQIGYYFGQPMDVYIWEGGVSDPPGAVLWVAYNVPVPGEVAFWPEVSQHDVEIAFPVSGEFALGFWVDFSASTCQYFLAADENGPGGHPWVNIAPGIGYPTGWADPSMVWGHTESLGLGAYFVESPTPVTSQTWGRIRALFGS